LGGPDARAIITFSDVLSGWPLERSWSSNGLGTWTSSLTHNTGPYAITVRVTDSGTPPASTDPAIRIMDQNATPGGGTRPTRGRLTGVVGRVPSPGGGDTAIMSIAVFPRLAVGGSKH